MTSASFSPNKTQFYTANGFGRDSYIHANNGGFVPMKGPVKCEVLGNFVVQKQRPAEPHAYIHSKPVVYTNNGGGRDTYISGNAGGFRPMHANGFGKATFYNQLRQYGQCPPPMDKAGSQLFGTRKRSTTLQNSGVHQSGSKGDVFQSSQDHFSPKYRQEMGKVHNYQHSMDKRLSKPKEVNEIEDCQRTSQARIRVFKNSSPNEQLPFQAEVYGRNLQSPRQNGPMLQQMDSFDRLNGPYANAQ